MPGPVQTCLFVTVLLLAALAGSDQARAEMTEADRAGQSAFTVCWDETGGDENACLEKLRRHAWYPRDDATCQAVGARVEKVLELGGVPKYRDLFMNERCARLGLPHNRIAAAAGVTRIGNEYYFLCGETGFVDIPYCDTSSGRYLWHPRGKSRICRLPIRALEEDLGGVKYMKWSTLFETERCHRLGEEYFQPEKRR